MMSKRSWPRCVRSLPSLRAGLSLLVRIGVASTLFSACLDRPVSPAEPRTSNLYVGMARQKAVDKIDLLLMIDNSMSMRDKQEILAKAVPGLVQRLIQPLLDPATGQPEFREVKDIHVGIITSSLGAHGGTQCNAATDDDHGYLLGKVRQVASWANSGFLAWDPLAVDPMQAKNSPAGETDAETFRTQFSVMIDVVGQTGCGYEASLEAWYRFLIDPEPPLSIGTENGVSVVQGVDASVLEQRAAFLRPDSLVAIIMLTDENDCSIRDDGYGWLVSETSRRLYRSTVACKTDPNDTCCRSCGSIETSGAPPGCAPLTADPECQINDSRVEAATDQANLRCYDQKRRFGMDLLYPTSRYVEALTSDEIRKRDGTLVRNPLFTPAPGKPVRDKDLVFLAGIVGVPWQDIADPASVGGSGLRYMTAEELAANGRWQMILGDPAKGTLPLDPLMIETPEERSGQNPVTGAALQPSSSSTPNPINGREQVNVDNFDLQYACTFPLAMPRTCAQDAQDCDCTPNDLGRQRPLCSQTGAGTAGTTQYWAKAYPGLRHLQVLKDFGKNSIVASICPKVVQGADTDPSYGYNPAVSAIVDRLKVVLQGQCLPRELPVETEGENAGKVPCAVVEAMPMEGGQCQCDGARRRRDPAAQVREPVRDQLRAQGNCGGPNAPACDSFCLCEILQTEGPALESCQNEEPADPSAIGYCYIDAESDPKIGNEKLVANCKPKKRLLRFVGNDTPANGAIAIVACLGATLGN